MQRLFNQAYEKQYNYVDKKDVHIFPRLETFPYDNRYAAKKMCYLLQSTIKSERQQKQK